MKKRYGGRIIAIVLGVVFLGTVAFLVSKSRKPAVVYEHEQPVVMDIVEKTVTTGSIVPLKEIAVKSRMSGIVNEVFVEPGDAVSTGDQILSVKLVPDNVNVNRAELELRKARISLDKAQVDLERQEGLHTGEIITDAELEKYKLAYELAKEDLEWADTNLALLREGASRKSGQVSNVIYSPSTGTVLEVPVKAGGPVIESNSYNEGTTVATIADMGTLVFEGQLDESEIGKVRRGMELLITVAALGDARLSALLDFIAPKGVVNQGAVQFQIKAPLSPPRGMLLRAGYSASADIVLARANQALSVREQNVIFQEAKSFVEVETGKNQFTRREVKLGLSDGIHVQVKSGLSAGEYIKVQTVSEKVRTP